MHMAMMPTTPADLCPWSWDDAESRQNILTPFSILIEFEGTEYLYSVRIKNFDDIRFDIRFD